MAKDGAKPDGLIELLKTCILFTSDGHGYRAIELLDFLTLGCLGSKPYSTIRKMKGCTFLSEYGGTPLGDVALAELDSNGDKRYVYAFPVRLGDTMYCLVYGKLTAKPGCTPLLISVGGVSIFSRAYAPAVNPSDFAMECIDRLFGTGIDCDWAESDGVGYDDISRDNAIRLRVECVSMFNMIRSAPRYSDYDAVRPYKAFPDGLKASNLEGIKGGLRMGTNANAIVIDETGNHIRILAVYEPLSRALGVNVLSTDNGNRVIPYVRLSELVRKVHRNIKENACSYINLEALYPDQSAISVNIHCGSVVAELYMKLYEYEQSSDGISYNASLGYLYCRDVALGVLVIDDMPDTSIKTYEIDLGNKDTLSLLQKYAEDTTTFKFSQGAPAKRAEYVIATSVLQFFEEIVSVMIRKAINIDRSSDIDIMDAVNEGATPSIATNEEACVSGETPSLDTSQCPPSDKMDSALIAITERELKEKHEAEKAELNRVTSVILSNAMPLSDAVLPRDTSMLKFMMCVARVNRVVNFYFVTKELDIHVLSAIPTKELNETPNSQYIQAVAYIMNQTFKLRNIDHSNDIADAGTLSTFESLNEMAYNPNFRFERRDIKTGIYAKQSIIKVDDLIMGFIDNLDIGSDRFYLNPIKWLEAASISVDNKSFAKTVINYSGDKTIKDISISTSSISPNYKLWVTMEKKIVMRPNDAGAIQYISGDYDRQLKAKPNLGAMFNALELASAKGGDGLKW